MATTTRLFRWGAHYKIGVAQIDREHQQVADLLNELHDAWLDGAPRSDLSGRLKSLAEAVTVHFEAEEKIMAERGYPGLPIHRSEHAFLLTHVADFRQGFENGTTEFTESVMSYLKDWLRDHILISDKRMGEYLVTH